MVLRDSEALVMRKHSTEEWRQLFALLDTALDLPPAEREAWLFALGDEPARLSGALRDLLSLKAAAIHGVG
jgi:hypothetical protein